MGQPKSFAEGRIRIAHVDTDSEPACCSSHLLIFIPAEGPHGDCFAVSQRKTGEGAPVGFSNVAFGRIGASYNPRHGLILVVPYTVYDAEKDRRTLGVVKIRVDLREPGSVAIER